MNIYKDLAGITSAALHYANGHNKNYTIIIHNPVDGKFDPEKSTYEFVADSYFEKPRDNVVKVYDTNELLAKEETSPVFKDVIMPTRGAGSLHKIGFASHGRIAHKHGHGEPDVVLVDKTLQDIKTIGTEFPIRIEKYPSSFNGHPPFKRKNKKIQNNEPCYCGSGKKFKNCHKHK